MKILKPIIIILLFILLCLLVYNFVTPRQVMGVELIKDVSALNAEIATLETENLQLQAEVEKYKFLRARKVIDNRTGLEVPGVTDPDSLRVKIGGVTYKLTEE